MDLAGIQSMVRYLTKEPYPAAPTFATNARVLEFANLGQTEIATRTKCFVSSNVPNSTADAPLNTVAGQWSYAAPTDCLEILKIKVSVWNCERVSVGWLNQTSGFQFWKFSGNPSYYWTEQKGSNSFGLFRTPSGVWPIAMWYVRKPTALVNSTDVPDLDRRLDMALVYWINEKIMEGRREIDYKAGYWEKKFEGELLKYNTTADISLEPIEFLGCTPVPSD